MRIFKRYFFLHGSLIEGVAIVILFRNLTKKVRWKSFQESLQIVALTLRSEIALNPKRQERMEQLWKCIQWKTGILRKPSLKNCDELRPSGGRPGDSFRDWNADTILAPPCLEEAPGRASIILHRCSYFRCELSGSCPFLYAYYIAISRTLREVNFWTW